MVRRRRNQTQPVIPGTQGVPGFSGTTTIAGRRGSPSLRGNTGMRPTSSTGSTGSTGGSTSRLSSEERRIGNRPGTPSARNLSWDYLPPHAVARNVATELSRIPAGGSEMEDLFLAYGLLDETSGGGTGGRGGGGGLPANPDPLGWNAIAREQALREAYGQMGGAIGQQEQALLDAVTAREGRIGQAGADARRRLEESVAGLGTMAGQTAEQVGQAYGQAGMNIDQLLQQYVQQQQALGQGAARTLGAFGVGPEELGVLGPSVAETMGAYRGALAGLGGVSQADLAQRPLAYQALSGDVLARLTAEEQRAVADAAAERARIQADAARQRAELALQQYPQLFAIQDAEIARRQGYA